MTKVKISELSQLTFLLDKKIGILGGSFNPAHEGHLAISTHAIEYLKLDYVIWLVAKQNPLKETYQADMTKRANYALQIAQAIPQILVSTIEEKIADSQNTINVLKAIKHEYSSLDITWLMGDDCLKKFEQWPESENFVKYAKIAIFRRHDANYSYKNTIAYNKFLKYQLDRVIFCDNKLIDISSSEIRKNNKDPFRLKRNV